MKETGHPPIKFEFTTFVTAIFDRRTSIEKTIRLQTVEGLNEGLNEGLKSLLSAIF